MDLGLYAIALILSGESMYSLPDHTINRMLVCGDCPKSPINPEEAKAAFRTALDELIGEVEAYNREPQTDEEKAEVRRIYQEANAEAIKEQADIRRKNLRLHKLKRRMEDGEEV